MQWRVEEHTGVTTWFGLGPDVSGICDGCKKNRTLIARHGPTDHWFCRPCFRRRMVASESVETA